MSFGSAVEAFQRAQGSDDMAIQDIATGLIDLTKAIRSELDTIERLAKEARDEAHRARR